ncbi:MAG TPA: EAL domain-containing protein [Nitrospirota bacterium]|nr:EAL domain-containing protein [Nitrospirota bacterium]
MENKTIHKRTLFNKDSSQTAEILTTVLDNITQGMVIVGPDYSVRAFNKQLETLLGLQQGTVEVGSDFRDTLKGWADVTGQTQDMLEQTLRELDLPNPFKIEFQQTIRGVNQWCLLTHNPLLSKGFVRIYSDITAKKKADEQHMYDAFHDPLTGLPNRALFLDRLQHVITASQRRHGTYNYAVFFLDLDRFKVINDSHGHTIGDQLLIAVGRKLTDCIRPGDTIARLGGDEFALLLHNINDPAYTVNVAERIQKKLAVPLDIKGRKIFTSISIGIALGSESYERPEQVLRDADIAMYESKGRGNGSCEIFDIKLHANILDRMQLVADLRGAVDNKELTLYYQPIIALKTQQLTGFEALVRWNHPTRGLIYPMEFIPSAEEHGLIYQIGAWILHEACRELKLLQVRHPAQPPLNMSVNISSKQFSQQDLAGMLSGFLAETGVDPHTMILEITESMIMENVNASVETMNRLRNMGVQIHIDDFGTGHSSLSYLQLFPINALKIDRSFINKLTASGDNQEIITHIVSLAQSLHFEVIAEGIEMEHQLVNIKNLHCGYGQGFLFARPMAFNAIDAWMQGQKHQL